ncbi:hypothetical protein VL10_22145 [Leclercia adecarboxylata]|nr:hypothetical protein VL10_22145 [Leclercia adecarboxylata]
MQLPQQALHVVITGDALRPVGDTRDQVQQLPSVFLQLLLHRLYFSNACLQGLDQSLMIPALLRLRQEAPYLLKGEPGPLCIVDNVQQRNRISGIGTVPVPLPDGSRQ